MELGILLNVTARNDHHVPDIERYIRTIKVCARCIFNTLPYKSIPGIMIVEMIQFCVFWLNRFTAAKDSSSDTLSLRYIVGAFTIEYTKYCKVEFGSYVQANEKEHNNSMISQTTGAIVLQPTGNVQGGYYYMSLTSCRRLICSHWTELPVPVDVINQVHTFARKGNVVRGLMFADRDGQLLVEDPYGNINDDEDDAQNIQHHDENLEENFDEDNAEEETSIASEDENVFPDINEQADDDNSLTGPESVVQKINEIDTEVEYAEC